MNTAVHFSSATNEWATPQWLFDILNKEFKFTTDVCSNGNHKVDHYYTVEMNGLIQDWRGVCWMNPPYGRAIKDGLKKAYEESLKGAVVVCLIPARTDTRYWHDYVRHAQEIRFIKGRLKFGGSLTNAPFPSCVVIFDSSRNVQKVIWQDYPGRTTEVLNAVD